MAALSLLFSEAPSIFAAAPRLVKDINGNAAAEPRDFTPAADGTLYFTADDGINGREVWMSDGSVEGTVMVRDLHPGSAGFESVIMTPFAGGMTFTASLGSTSLPTNRTLWYTDGSFAGTVPLRQHPYRNIRNLTVFGSSLYFMTSLSSGEIGTELWSALPSGTTTLVKSIPQSSWAHQYNPTVFSPAVTMGGVLYFQGVDPFGVWLWKSDGTPDGTVKLKYLCPPRQNDLDNSPGWLAVCNGRIYFSVPDPVVGQEPWISDGTAEGTGLLKDLTPGAIGTSTGNFTAAAGTVFFRVWSNNSGWDLWKTDGTAAGTHIVKDINPDAIYASIESLTAAEGRLFFAVSKNNSGELWTSDGTTNGTVMVRNLRPGSLAAAGSRVYFTANDGIHGLQIWVSDGTGAGTVMQETVDNYYPANLLVAGRRLYFNAWTPETEIELWSLPVLAAPEGKLTLRSVSTGTATFDATVDPGAQTVSAVLQYGPTTAYGQTKSIATSPDNTPEPLTVSLTGLPAGATGHARLVITNADGTFTGPDVPFTTLTAAYAAWMQANFGTAEASGNSAPEADADGDAQTNYFEFLAGTNPQSGASAFVLRFDSTSAVVEFGPVRPGVHYILEISDNLEAWTELPAVSFDPPNAMTTVPLPVEAASKRFVRARLEPAP